MARSVHALNFRDWMRKIEGKPPAPYPKVSSKRLTNLERLLDAARNRFDSYEGWLSFEERQLLDRNIFWADWPPYEVMFSDVFGSQRAVDQEFISAIEEVIAHEVRCLEEQDLGIPVEYDANVPPTTADDGYGEDDPVRDEESYASELEYYEDDVIYDESGR